MSQEPKVTRFGALPLIDSELATKAYVDGAGGGGQTFARAVTTSDVTINSDTVLHDDIELFIALDANEVYGFMVFGNYNSGSTPDFKYAFTHPAGSIGTYNFDAEQTNVSRVLTNTAGLNGGAGDRLFIAIGRIVMAGTAGDLQFQWAQNTSNAGDTVRKAGSYMVVWEEL